MTKYLLLLCCLITLTDVKMYRVLVREPSPDGTGNPPMIAGRLSLVHHLATARQSARSGEQAMISATTRLVVVGVAFVAAATTLAAETDGDAKACRQRVQVVTGLRGCVAFWDFVQREPDGQQRFTAHVPPGATNDFPLDAGNYIKNFWCGTRGDVRGLSADGRGPFGNAIRIVKEADADFRPFLFVPRAAA